MRNTLGRLGLPVLIIVATALVGATAALVATKLMKPTYTATVSEYVTVEGGKSADQLVAMNQLLSNRATSYTALVKTSAVLEPVVQELGLDLTPAELAERVTSSVEAETVLITIAVTDPDARRAADIAGAVGRSLARAVPQLEDVSGTGMAIKLTNVQPAAVPVIPSSPSTGVNAVVGFLAGAVLGYVIAALLAVWQRRAGRGEGAGVAKRADGGRGAVTLGATESEIVGDRQI